MVDRKSAPGFVKHEKAAAMVHKAAREHADKKGTIEVDFSYCPRCDLSCSGDYAVVAAFASNHSIMCPSLRAARRA